jgi:hypothetical protein
MTIYRTDTIDTSLRRIRAIAEELPVLSSAARIYEAITPILCNADLHVGPIPLTAQEGLEKITAGQPLLSGIDLDIDCDAALELAIALARAIESSGQGNKTRTTEAAYRIRTALEEKSLDISALLPHIVAGEHNPLVVAAQQLGLEHELVRVIAQNVLKPAFWTWRRQLMTMITQEISWHKEMCFVCGAGATLAELQENNQVKHMRCGQCGADWVVRRLQCLSCGNEDHGSQHCLYAEEERTKMYIDVCDNCKGYQKVIAAFTPTSPEMLAIEDLATLHLDYRAQKHGYVRLLDNKNVKSF